VIIPTYNSADTLEETLRALTGQELIEYSEIIVVDDGSTDDTARMVKNFEVRYYRKQNGGPASARNLGIDNAQGEIVLFLDSDCVPQTGWLKQMTEPFKDKSVYGVKGVYITRQKSLIARFVQLEFEERYLLLSSKETIDFVDTYSAGFRIEALKSVGGFDESFPKADNEDVDLSYKLARAGYRMVFQPKAVIEHTHPGNLLRYLKIKFNRGFWRTAVYQRHPGKALKDSYTPQTLKLQILSAFGVWMGLIVWLFTGLWQFPAFFGAVFLMLTLLFMSKVFKYDSPAAAVAPALLFLRATCFTGGIGAGLLRHGLFRRVE
jgi:GT2 family glycosyltransferase